MVAFFDVTDPRAPLPLSIPLVFLGGKVYYSLGKNLFVGDAIFELSASF